MDWISLARRHHRGGRRRLVAAEPQQDRRPAGAEPAPGQTPARTSAGPRPARRRPRASDRGAGSAAVGRFRAAAALDAWRQAEPAATADACCSEPAAARGGRGRGRRADPAAEAAVSLHCSGDGPGPPSPGQRRMGNPVVRDRPAGGTACGPAQRPGRPASMAAHVAGGGRTWCWRQNRRGGGPPLSTTPNTPSPTRPPCPEQNRQLRSRSRRWPPPAHCSADCRRDDKAPRQAPRPVPAADGPCLSGPAPGPARLRPSPSAETRQTALSSAASEAASQATRAEPSGHLATDQPYGEGSAAPAADGSGPVGFTVKGNASSMIYHEETSPAYEETRAEVWFLSAAHAEAAGFRPPRRTRQ